MKKKRSNKALYIQIFLVFGIMFAILALFGSIDLTGFAVFKDNTKFFTINEFNYNDTSFIFDKGLKLKGIVENVEVEKDLYSFVVESDYFNEISILDNETVIVENSFDIIFDDAVTQLEKLKFNVLGNVPCDVHLCDLGEICDFPGYGNFYYDGENREYFVDLNTNKISFTVVVGNIVEFDFITGIYTGLINETIIRYPEEGIVDTVDFEVESLGSWDGFVQEGDEHLVYFYSIDSGESWNLIDGDDLSSCDVSSGKIRFRILFTNEESVLKQLGVIYTLSKVGIDPFMNKKEILRKYYFDKYGVIPFESNIITSIDFSDRMNLEFKFKKAFNGEIKKERFFDEKIAPSNLKNIGRFDEINVSPEINENLVAGIMKIYYIDEEIEGLDESSLKLYTYVNDEWIELDSGVNMDENYVWANIDHFSVFAILGEVPLMEEEFEEEPARTEDN